MEVLRNDDGKCGSQNSEKNELRQGESDEWWVAFPADKGYYLSKVPTVESELHTIVQHSYDRGPFAMTIRQYLAWFDEVLAPTEPMFLLVPPDKVNWKLTEGSFTIGQLINHMPRALWFMAKVINGEEHPYTSIQRILVSNRRQESSSPEEAVALLKTFTASYKEAIARLGDDRFQNGIVHTPQKGRIQYWRYAAFTLEHHIHHLMELHVSLKVLHVKVDTGTLYVR